MLFAANANAYISLFLIEYKTRRIVIDGVVFNWVKSPENNTNNLVVNEIITNGRISESVHITFAVYDNNKGTGNAADFGTLENNFTDGNYKDVEYYPF